MVERKNDIDDANELVKKYLLFKGFTDILCTSSQLNDYKVDVSLSESIKYIQLVPFRLPMNMDSELKPQLIEFILKELKKPYPSR